MHEYFNLIAEFKEISNKKWIKSISKSFGSIGLTFENELKKKPDALFFPDYYGIEIKCTSRYSQYPLYLFTLAFDGPTFPEINRIIELYGYPDKDFNNKKVLFSKVFAHKKTVLKDKYKFQLEVNKSEQKVYLKVYDMDNELIEKKSFVYFDSIYNHLVTKLSKLAIVYASKKKIDNSEYYRYSKMSLYKLISFDKFIELLTNGTIIVDLIARISKSGADIGRHRNKNLVFSIRKEEIEKLFNKVGEIDIDNKKHAI